MSSVEFFPKGVGPSKSDMAPCAMMPAREYCQVGRPGFRSGAHSDQSLEEAL